MTSCAQGALSVGVAIEGSVDDAFSNRALGALALAGERSGLCSGSDVLVSRV
jgi:hypothetical protein